MVEIRAMSAGDWGEVEVIYASGIATGHATFETEPPSWEEFNRGRLAHSRLAELHGRWRDTLLLELRI